jgi:transcriptional regulator with XRE-family HTH domain
LRPASAAESGAPRRALGVAQGDFAQRIGVNRNMVIRYERGQAVPRARVLVRIAREGHVTVEWLVGQANEQGRRDMEWEEAVRALRTMWPNAQKWRLVMDMLRRLR